MKQRKSEGNNLVKKWGLPLVTGSPLVKETVDELDSDKAKRDPALLGYLFISHRG